MTASVKYVNFHKVPIYKNGYAAVGVGARKEKERVRKTRSWKWCEKKKRVSEEKTKMLRHGSQALLEK